MKRKLAFTDESFSSAKKYLSQGYSQRQVVVKLGVNECTLRKALKKISTETKVLWPEKILLFMICANENFHIDRAVQQRIFTVIHVFLANFTRRN